MRSALLLLAAALPAAAFDLMEYKNGKLVAVEEATREGNRLRVRFAMPEGQQAETLVPIDRVLPEFVFYAWAKDLPKADRAAHMELADWARKNHLYRLALKVQVAAGEFDEGIRAQLPAITKTLHDEEATWLFEKAEALFKAGQVREARVEVDRLLLGFQGSVEAGRAVELRTMIDEREKFLSEERKREEARALLRRQRIEVKTEVARIAQGDGFANGVNLRFVGEARWRLHYATYLYDGVVARLDALYPYVEDEALREEIVRRIDAAQRRAVSAYLRLGDLRYLTGDLGAALDAAHQVLDIDPANAAAAALRDRILDGPGPLHIKRDGGFLTYRKTFAGGGFGIRRGR